MPKQLHSDFLKGKVNTLLELMQKASKRSGTGSESWTAYATVMAGMEGAYQTALLRELLEKQAGLMPVHVEEGRKFRLDSEDTP